jgi:predicted branched-subunit amino acid permease
VSFSFGIAAQNILQPLQAVIMSASNYTSAGQFAALGLIVAASGYWEMALAQLIINLRYSLMACVLSQKLESGAPAFHRFIMSMGITDEIFGVSASVSGRLSPWYMYGAMCSAMPGWVLGTFLGVISHGLMPAKILSALGIAIYGMFIAIIIPPTRGNLKLAGIIAVSMLCSLLVDTLPALSEISPGLKIIFLTLIIAGGAAALFPVRPEEERSEDTELSLEGGAR